MVAEVEHPMPDMQAGRRNPCTSISPMTFNFLQPPKLEKCD
jgi:hypothetical protein